MKYKNKIVKLPTGMTVGSEIFILGEGYEIFKITSIKKLKNGETDIFTTANCVEPLSKIYLIPTNINKTKNNWQEDVFKDQKNRIYTAIGECDYCKTVFPDSCVWHINPKVKNSMICNKCVDKLR